MLGVTWQFVSGLFSKNSCPTSGPETKMAKYTDHVQNKKTPQSEPIPGSSQVPNSAGGYSFAVDDWTRLDRFLVLGTEGGSYYASEKTLTKDNAKAVERCIKADGPRVVNRVVEISDQGRAPKNDPAILVLAMCAKLGDDETRRLANASLEKVCRIGTHVMHFAEYVEAFGGWGRGTRTAIARWYTGKPLNKLAHQMVKYQSRDKWSNRDLLRLSHAKAPNDEYNALFRWTDVAYTGDKLKDKFTSTDKALRGDVVSSVPDALQVVWAFEQAKKATNVKDVVKLIEKYDLPRECVPTQFLTEASVWAALLPKMGLTALVRNLATMTRVGLLKPLSTEAKMVVDRLGDQEQLIKTRIHPIAMLTALKTYQAGHSVRGSSTWTPIQAVCDALDGGFYKSFKAIEPAGKAWVLALDVSGSMDDGDVAGVPGLTPRIASAAMSLVTSATEAQTTTIAFSSGKQTSTRSGSYGGRWDSDSSAVTEVNITSRDRLDTVIKKSSELSVGMKGTDCALPMIWALENKIKAETFVVYTDSETWHGSIHPVQALREYRQKTGIPAKLIVVAMVANEFTIADPDDAGMLDVCGFDSAVPSLMADFARK
jgi:60 kDa SS-A/Ro ribonucleoprotein